MTNLAFDLVETASKHPDRPALRLDDHVVTYRELHLAAARAADLLRAENIWPGDRIGIAIPNVPAFPVMFYAVLMAGAVVVPINPLLKMREVDHYLDDAGISLVIATSGAAGAMEAAAQNDIGCLIVDDIRPVAPPATEPPLQPFPRERDDTAVILYTSGTTGRPKGAELTHHSLATNTRTTVDTLIQVTEHDVIMGCLPLFHVFGLVCGLGAAVHAGSCLTLMPRFDAARALEIAGRDRVTVFEGVPTMYAAMLHHPDDADMSSLRTCISGGSALPVEVLAAFERRFGCEIYEGYGLSETSSVACFNQPGYQRKPGTVGFEVRNCRIRVVDEHGNDVAIGHPGEIAIQGANLMKGYWKRPDATASAVPDGWFRTGDIGTKDADGFYTLLDRKKDMILRGGLNIYPREVEEVLYEHPAVAEAAVVGVPHDELGQEVGAAVALKPGRTATPEELRNFVRERLAAYKYPRHLTLVNALPKGPTGKILRREIDLGAIRP